MPLKLDNNVRLGQFRSYNDDIFVLKYNYKEYTNRIVLK